MTDSSGVEGRERSAAMSRTDEYQSKALFLSTTTSAFKVTSTAPSRVGFDPEAEFDYESKAVTPDSYETDAALLQARYRKLCGRLGVVPVSLLMKQIGNSSVVVKDANLSPLELKAALTVLVMDTELTQLDISGNTFRKHETERIGQLLRTNRFLVQLDTECIADLILHHNELGQCCVDLGQVIANNDTITTLNLSWNHIRGPGAVGLAQGLGKNSRLTHVNFAWNGFGFEGCVALGQALKANSTLHHLNLTNNRIHPPALLQLFNGVCSNKVLGSLILGLNPIPASVTTFMLDRIAKWKHGNLKELDLQGIVVDNDFFKVLEEIQANRMFYVRFDSSLPFQLTRRESKVDPNNIYNIDPMRILFFMKEHLRTIDLFLKIDHNNDGLVSRDEMKYAFELEGYPISDKALDQVMLYLDTNKSGEVDLREFFTGERRMRRDQTKEQQEQEERLKQQGLANPIGGSPSTAQTVSPGYSQAFKKPVPRLPKLTK
ncbi:leucine-rich repeat-containing protein 74B-like [Littorina saxatilis]|uniref:leucine-rich repeat-containing protein 74B-like n=1 Tax=Littorina saxatilis TaxID=31220 RepID=UPI0038B5F448